MTILSSPEVLLVEQRGSIAQFTLNRPDKCNALNIDLNIALTRACESLPKEVTIVVLSGNGRHFCAGSDLTDLYQIDHREVERVIELEMHACHALAALPQLTVAIMQGKCYGGGALLPLYCDLRIGFQGVEFALPEVSLGWTPPYGLERLLATVPPSFALEMLLSGRTCGDREALERGLLHRLMATGEETRSYLEQLAAIPHRTLTDTYALTHSKNLERMREADQRALAAFLNHFDTDRARNMIASFVDRKRN